MGQTVIDMSKVRMDFFRNEITHYTLKFIDDSFFSKQSDQPDGAQFKNCA